MGGNDGVAWRACPENSGTAVKRGQGPPGELCVRVWVMTPTQPDRVRRAAAMVEKARRISVQAFGTAGRG